jgi:stringent starvation protein B
MSAKSGSEGTTLPRRPYLLRAMHEWITDSGLTPHVIVDAQRPGVEVPAAYVKDGKIVLNLSMTATQRLQLKNDWIEFDARFAGVVHHVRVPLSAVLGVYARETGEGMIFSETEGEPTPPESPAPREGPASAGPARKPKLTVVK